MPGWLDQLLRRKPPLEPEDAYLEAFFTDVEHLCDLFQRLVTAPNLPRRILVIHGVGGVGKSTLLRMFRLFCKRQGIPVSLVGTEEIKSAVDVLTTQAEDLAQGSAALPDFSSTFERYRTIQAKVARKAKETEGAAAKLGKAAAKTLVETATSAIPVVGPLASALGGMAAEAFVDWLQGFLSKPEIDLYLDPVKRLTNDFLADVTKAAARRRLVLMLDTYEQIGALDEWVREWIKALHTNVLVVIAGRMFPGAAWERAWPGWMAQAQVEELKPMTDDDLRVLVRRYYAHIRRGEPDPQQVEAIAQFARGLPMAATTVVQLWVEYGVEDFQAVRPQVVADLVDRLLEGVPQEMRPAFEVAAVLRYFNTDVLQALLDSGDADELYAELRRWPFIRPRREGLAVHDTMRKIMNEALRVRTPGRFYALHERAAAYYEVRLEKATGDERVRLMLERLYHRVRADEEAGVRLFCEAAEELVCYRLVNQLRALMNDVNTYPLERESGRLWREYYKARLIHLEKRLSEAEAVYRRLLEGASYFDHRLRAKVLLGWAEILTRPERLSQPDGAARALLVLEKCERILPAQDPDRPLLLILKAHVHRRQPNGWKKAEEALTAAIALCKERHDYYGLTTAYNLLKGIYAHQGFWKKVLEVHNRALHNVIPEGFLLLLKARILAGWQVAWIWMGRYAEAERVLKEVVDIEIRMGRSEKRERPPRDLLLSIGMQKRETGVAHLFDAAIERYRALGEDFANDLAYFLGFRGMVALRCGNLRQAEIYLTEALRIVQVRDPIQSVNWGYWVGMCYLAQGHWSKAEKHFSDCLTAQHIGHNYFECGTLTGLVCVKHAQGQCSAIPPLLAKAEAMAQRYEYNDHLASLRLTQGHIAWKGHIPDWDSGFEAALHYYQQALIYALRYNRFLLDEVLWGDGIATPLQPIIPHCLKRGEEGRRMLVALRDWWQAGVNDIGTPRPDTISPIPEGVSLLEAERIARKREPGDGNPQKTAVERINAALTTAPGANTAYEASQ